VCAGLPAVLVGDDLNNVIDIQAAPYNADRTGIVDAAPIIRAANQAGGVAWLGNGTFRIKSTISPQTNTAIIGQGATILIDDSGGNIGDAFLLDAVRNVKLSGFTIDAVSPRSAGAHVRVKGGDPSFKLGSFAISRAQHVIDVDCNNFFDGVVVEDKSATNGAWGVSIGGTADRFNFFTNGATGRFPVDINTPHGASILLNYLWPVGNATPANGPAGIRIRGSGDTTLIGVRTWGTQQGLIVDPQVNGAESVMAIDASGCYFDFANAECFRFNPIAGLTIPIVANFVKTWFASSLTTHDVRGSNGTGHRVNFGQCSFLNAAAFGLRGDTGCDATTFGNNNCNFGPPLVNASGGASYV